MTRGPLPDRMSIQFQPSPRASLGVEVELEIVDGKTRRLANVSTPILEAMGQDHPEGIHPKAKHELFEPTIEILTSVCASVSEARADLEATIAEIKRHTDPRGVKLMCSGTHPISDWKDAVVSPNPRYQRLIDQMQWLARRMLIFGVHIHVGVRAPEKVIPIVNALTYYIPHFLALSASSPYWVGADTGLASSRSKVFEGLPTAGLPYQLSGWSEFEDFMATLISAHTIETIREVWWDIRPHPHFGTVELRVCDGIPSMTEVASITALFQCLVQELDERMDRGEDLGIPREWVVRENKWRAARHGLDCEIIVDERGHTRPVRESVAELVDQLAPVSKELQCADELAGIISILDRGPSYIRQREVVGAGGSLEDVVDALILELETGVPGQR